MAGVLWISTTFLTGRYHGEEWPPSPARLLQALVAGVKNGGNREMWPQVEEGLRWLEHQAPPRIYARPKRQLSKYRVAVPNIDLDVIAKEWAVGRPANIATIRTMKDIKPRLVEGPVPHVRYVWNLEGSDEGGRMAALLAPAVRCLYSLGWGVDMAYADSGLSSDERGDGWEEWIPDERGERKAVPIPGFLDDLEATYRRFTARAVGKGVDTETRLRVYGLQPYSRIRIKGAPWKAFGLRTVDGEEIFSKPWRSAMEVAAWMRHAANTALIDEDIGENLNGFVLGHPEDSDAANHRLSFVPLPSIHAQHGDGRIRRIMVVEPLGGSGRAVALLSLKWIGQVLSNEHGHGECVVESPDGRVTPLYVNTARVWRSVTPVVLHGHNATHGVVSVGKTERLLFRAFEMAGRSTEQIQSLAFQAAPLWRGAGAAKSIRVPRQLDGYPRYHVEVTFQAPIEGPMLAGIGRHYGIGVFASAEQKLDS
jgi:CRISPR-associated protein Csb2